MVHKLTTELLLRTHIDAFHSSCSITVKVNQHQIYQRNHTCTHSFNVTG